MKVFYKSVTAMFLILVCSLHIMLTIFFVNIWKPYFANRNAPSFFSLNMLGTGLL